MWSDDVRAVLESIAFGADEAIRPSDRLTAIRELGALEPGTLAAAGIFEEVIGMTDAQLEVEHDQMLADGVAEALSLSPDERSSRFPAFTAALEAYLHRSSLAEGRSSPG
jgi:hypothetical protein